MVYPSGNVDYNNYNDASDSYGLNAEKSPDTYMGGSEGVMQVTDYGDIQFETWLHVSYGKSPDLTYPDAYYVDRGGDTYSRYYVTGSYGKKLGIPYFRYT